jgi:HEAT repeat protein
MPITPEFANLLALLRDTDHPFPAQALYYFSSLTPDHLAALEAAWPEVDPDRRANVLDDLSELSEANFEVSFEAVFRLALEDELAPARVNAIQGLWEVEEPELMGRFLHLMLHDPAVEVRAAAAIALGRFVYLGEVEEISPAQAQRIEETLMAVIHGSDDLEVRRRALEALAYSSRPEVTSLISAAYASDEEKMRVSAVFAMGRSADEQWVPQIITELESVTPEIRFEAARAAGELEIEEATPALSKMGEDSDRQVREAAIWSLSQVGGPDARKMLKRLLRQAEPDEREFVLDAIDNLDFVEEVRSFALFDFDPTDISEAEPD